MRKSILGIFAVAAIISTSCKKEVIVEGTCNCYEVESKRAVYNGSTTNTWTFVSSTPSVITDCGEDDKFLKGWKGAWINQPENWYWQHQLRLSCD